MKNIKQSIKILIVALVLSAGFALAWTAPTTTPTGGNAPAPINDSTEDQIKIGGLSVKTILVDPGLTKFYGDITVGKKGAGKDINIAGGLGIGAQPTSSGLNVAGGVRLSELSAGGRVCADSSGTLSLCPKKSVIFTTANCPVAGCTWVVPDGVFKATVDAYGAGGGGGATSIDVKNRERPGGGGGGGGYASGIFVVNPGQNISLTVGTGGAGGSRLDDDGKEGGATKFGPFLEARGGQGGKNGSGPDGGIGGVGTVYYGNFFYSTANGAVGGNGNYGTGAGGTGGAGAGALGAKGGNGLSPNSGNVGTGEDGKIIINFN